MASEGEANVPADAQAGGLQPPAANVNGTAAPTAEGSPSAPNQSPRPSSSPAAPGSPLHSPPLPAGALPPPSPGGSSNRFGLSLNFMQRRPRGNTNPGGTSRPTFGSSSLNRSPANSPGSELAPGTASSPGAMNEQRSGYGFPALRRTLSKRTNPGDSSRRMRSRSASQGPTFDAGATTMTGNLAGSSSEAIVQSTPIAQSTTPAAIASTSTGPMNAETVANSAPDRPKYRIRLVPHLESSRALHFEPVDRELTGFTVLKVGRFTDRSQQNAPDPLKIAFKSKVVSRGHAEIWVDDNGKWFIKDTKSSSGTFLNHIRLSGPGIESRPFAIKDGDVLQLGVDYQGGTEEIYRCVKIKVELNRGWQRGMNSFNTAALAQLRALGGAGLAASTATASAPAVASDAVPSKSSKPASTAKAAGGPGTGTSVTDCCICLYPVTVCQALFIAPCSHVTHFKCIRPLVNQNYPGFSCPLCRTYADLEADVEIEPWEAEEEEANEAAKVSTPAVVDESATGGDEQNATTNDDLTQSIRPGIPPTIDESGAGGDRASQQSSSSSRPVSITMPPAHGPNTIAHDALADAATPPNSTFLSTLADSGSFARFKDRHVSLDHAVTRANESAGAGPVAAGTTPLQATSSFISPPAVAGPSGGTSSDDDEFEELRNDFVNDGEERDSGTGELNDETTSAVTAQKGKGRETNAVVDELHENHQVQQQQQQASL